MKCYIIKQTFKTLTTEPGIEQFNTKYFAWICWLVSEFLGQGGETFELLEGLYWRSRTESGIFLQVGEVAFSDRREFRVKLGLGFI